MMLKQQIDKKCAGIGIFIALMIFIAGCGPVEKNNGQSNGDEHMQVLFIGDDGHHEPSVRLRDITRPLLNRGIELFYSSDINELTLENLKKYDAVLLYGNYHAPNFTKPYKDKIQALVDYVEQGGGFVAVHSASGSFRKSDAYISLIGGAFKSHGTGVVSPRIAKPDHEIMEGFEGFKSWDETYVHQKHNTKNRTVLSYRGEEPWTWIRTQGEGRVFYTAWGHDQRTWQNPGFMKLLERGIRWVAGQDVQKALANRKIEHPFKYAVLDVPFPPPHSVRLKYEKNVGPMDRGSNNPRFYKMQKPLPPQEAINRMIVPPGFHVELFASEPDIVNPIAMDWDAQGRLWVVESIEYPYPRKLWPDGGGKDRITIAEDTDGDGRADKFTEFADSLNIPTGLVFANGGVIVHQAPQTLFLKDTDGDDKADVRKVLFEGWSQYDTHAGPSHLRYGLDNWIWGVVGYSGFDGKVGGEHHEFRMGVYRFKPDGSELDFLHKTNNNTWGLGFNAEGGTFISTANGNPSTYMPFPKQLYDHSSILDDPNTQRLTNTARVITLTNWFRQVDWVGAFTAGAGHGFYTARKYPKRYWNRVAFVMDPTMHVVGEFIMTENGSSYNANYPRNLIASDDQWFSPVAAEVGPDGNVWIADWYNYVVQHNAESDRQKPTPGNAYANPLRDREHGRIYRIVYEDDKPSEDLNLTEASPQKLVKTLTHDNLFWRKHAQRLLVESGKTDVVPELLELIQDESVDELGLNVGAIHALWTLHGLGQLDGSNAKALKVAQNALQHPSAGVRQNALKVLPSNSASVEAILQNKLLQDPDPQVRRDALVMLAGMPASKKAGKAIFTMLKDSSNIQDHGISTAGALTATVHSDGFLEAAEAADKLPGKKRLGDKDSLSLDNIVHMVLKEHPSYAEEGANDEEVNQLPENIDAQLTVGVATNAMEFNKTTLRAKAGQTIRVVFNNTGKMEHNLLFIEPGSIPKIGKLADAMIGSPNARENNYTPSTPEVIAATPIVQSGESYELVFTVPDKPGKYRFICTIPGHWRTMQGTLIVE